MQDTVLIFGANGFVGPYLAREFKQCGYEVIGSDRADHAVSSDVSKHFTADLLDADRIAGIIKEVAPDYIVNLAAISSVGLSWKIPQQTMQVNIVGSLNILEGACFLDAPPKVLLVGSSEEYAPSLDPLSEESKIDATNPYGISKVAQEDIADLYASRFDIPIYKVRAFNHTGVGQAPAFVLSSWCQQVAEIERSGKPGTISVGNVDIIRDFSDVRDIVRAYRLLLESDHASTPFNIGSGVPHELKDLLQMIISFSNQEIAVHADPELFRPTDNPVILCDNSRAKVELGWQPQLPIEGTLSEMFLNCLNGECSG